LQINTKIEEVFIIGELQASNGISKINGFNVYVEPETEVQFNQFLEANGRFAVLERFLVNFTFETGDEECGLLISIVNPL
jgi:hypothetical protein